MGVSLEQALWWLATCPSSKGVSVGKLRDKLSYQTSYRVSQFLGDWNPKYLDNCCIVKWTWVGPALGILSLDHKVGWQDGVMDAEFVYVENQSPRKEWNNSSVILPYFSRCWTTRPAGIGTLNYLAQNTSPDIRYAVHQCAHFSTNPTWNPCDFTLLLTVLPLYHYLYWFHTQELTRRGKKMSCLIFISPNKR